jgi:ribokinase
MATKELKETGVDTSLLQLDDRAPTGMMFTPVTPDGERTMFGQRGANANTDPGLIGEDALAGARFLHLSGYALLEPPQREAALRAVRLAEDAGIPIGIDTAWLPAFTIPGELRALLPRLSMCVLGQEEALKLSGRDSPGSAALGLVEAGVALVGLKMGGAGSLLADETGVTVIPAFPVEAVDTTGAGDAFSAGLIYGHHQGLSLPAMGILANALGSLAARAWGAGSSLPGKGEVLQLLEESALTEEGERGEWIAEVRRAVEFPE